jgi:hypothetical protein
MHFWPVGILRTEDLRDKKKDEEMEEKVSTSQLWEKQR